VLSGSVGIAANLGVPDIVLSNMSDVVDHCRRITRMAAVSLMVDAEDGFGNAVNVRRTVQEMEAAGVSAIEIEDNAVPKKFNVRNPGLVSKEEQVGKLQAAVAARTDPSTVIVARTSALAECPLEEALDRIRAYATTGAEALMLATVPHGRADITAVHQATSLPLCVLNPPPEARNDAAFLADLGLKESGLDRVIRASYDLLALISFFTVGEDECRAWGLPKGVDAVEGAAQIHTDIARGFVRAEVVGYDDFKRVGSMKEAKTQGVYRLEGKTYIVHDGDIMHILAST